MQNSNFNIKVTLQEANDIKDALEERLEGLVRRRTRWEEEPQLAHQAGRIETMLRRDF